MAMEDIPSLRRYKRQMIQKTKEVCDQYKMVMGIRGSKGEKARRRGESEAACEREEISSALFFC